VNTFLTVVSPAGVYEETRPRSNNLEIALYRKILVRHAHLY
jgi:hypothetical protein